MKLFKSYILYSTVWALVLTGCQQEDQTVVDIEKFGNKFSIDDKAPNPPPAPEVTRQEFALATGWLIEWHNPDLNRHWEYKRFFSTVDGSVRTINALNASWKTTANADMDLLFGFVKSPDIFSLTYQNQAKATQFKPSDLTPQGLIDVTENNPALFQDLFENDPDAPTAFQPYNYEEEGTENLLYQPGDIFLFKTDRNPAKYGAIRIVEASNIYLGTSPRVIEVIVQKDIGIGGLTKKLPVNHNNQKLLIKPEIKK